MERIYLDHAATTPMDQRIVDKMMPYFTEIFGNPSSIHSYGREARKWLDEAREVIAGELHCKPQEIILTSGGTEATTWPLQVWQWQGSMKENISSQQKLSIMQCCIHASD